MTSRLRSPLSRRLIFYIVLCSSAITLLLTAFQLYRDYLADVRKIDSSFEQIRTVHLKTIELTVWATDRDKLQTVLDGISNLPDIEYVAVDEGDTITSVGKITSGNTVSKTYALTYLHHGKPTDIGELSVVANLDSVYARVLDRGVMILASNAIKTALVAGLMLLIFHTLVIRHLADIADFVSGLTLSKGFKPLALKRASPPGRKKDELDQVANAINVTGGRVIRAFSDLQKAEGH